MVLTRQGETAWPREERIDGVRVLRVPPSGPGRRGKYLMTPWALSALWRERRGFDLLVVRGTRVLGLPGLLAGRVLGKPVVLQAEVNGEMSGEIYSWGKRFEGRVTRGAISWLTRARNVLMRDGDAFVAMSRRIAEEFRQAGVPQERVRLIPHGVDTRRFAPVSPEEKAGLRRGLGLPEASVVFAYTGRLLRGKGLDTLLDAFGSLASRHPTARLLLIGSGEGQSLSVEEELRTRVRDQQLGSHVRFTGRVEEVAPYLGASDVFAFPSLFEALGLSLLEAAACGLPCLGSRTGGIVDVIEDGESGFLIQPGNRAAWTASLETIACDPARRRAMGARGRARVVAQFDVEDSTARYRALFAEMVGSALGDLAA